MTRTKPLSDEAARDAMGRGARLVKMHNTGGSTEHYVVPGGLVSEQTAAKLKEHPCIKGQAHGLFPKMEQTWSYIRD
jgi:hypothetical protein